MNIQGKIYIRCQFSDKYQKGGLVGLGIPIGNHMARGMSSTSSFPCLSDKYKVILLNSFYKFGVLQLYYRFNISLAIRRILKILILVTSEV